MSTSARTCAVECVSSGRSKYREWELPVDTVLLCCRVVPQFLPPTPDRLSRRAGGLEQLTCDEVKKAKIYFPGYRALVRL